MKGFEQFRQALEISPRSMRVMSIMYRVVGFEFLKHIVFKFQQCWRLDNVCT